MTFQGVPPFKHVGSFCVILFFALFRPAAIWPEVPVSTAPLAVLAAWLLLFYKIHNTVGYRAFLHQHRTLLLLIAGYFALCGASLIANYHRYPDMASFVRWGLTFPIIQSALVAYGFLFTLPQNQTGFSISRHPANSWLVLFVAALIPAVAFWQIMDNDGAFALYQYTVAGDMGDSTYVKRSILATSTDLGAVSAIIAMAALVLAIQTSRHRKWLCANVAVVIFAANAVAGIVSGSRGFFLAIGVGSIAVIYQLLGGRIKLMLVWALPLLLTGLLALLFAPDNVIFKMAAISPIFLSLVTGISPTKHDFAVNQISTALGDRADLWHRAITETIANPWLGISNGGYRLLNESLGEPPINNVHNAYLQLGVDAGLLGAILGALVIVTLLIRAKATARVPIYATVLAGLLVDNFADHSLAWIALATYAVSCSAGALPILTRQQKTWRNTASAAMTSILLFSALVAQYQNKLSALEVMELAEQIDKVRPYLHSNYWNSAPILITGAMDEELRQQGEARTKGTTALYPSIDASAYCAYSYPSAKLLYLRSEQDLIPTGDSRIMGSRWQLSHRVAPDTECASTDPRQISHWISNYHRHYGERLKNPNADLLMRTDYIAFFSPIFATPSNHEVTFNLTSKDLEGIPPTLVVHYYDAKTGAEITATRHNPDTGTSRLSVELPPAPSGKGFLKLKLENWRNDREKKSHQEVRIKSINLTQIPEPARKMDLPKAAHWSHHAPEYFF